MTHIPVTEAAHPAPFDAWLRSLTILHRGHWNAARWYDRAHLLLGMATGVTAAVSGTTALTTLVGENSAVLTGLLGLIAAVLAAIQTALRASELSARHKDAGIRFGQLRRELQERTALGLLERAEAEPWLNDFRARWNSADDQSPPVPPRFYADAKRALERPD